VRGRNFHKGQCQPSSLHLWLRHRAQREDRFIRCPLPSGPAIVQLDRTKRALAAEMGATSETLSRTFAKFRDQELLRVKATRSP